MLNIMEADCCSIDAICSIMIIGEGTTQKMPSTLERLVKCTTKSIYQLERNLNVKKNILFLRR